MALQWQMRARIEINEWIYPHTQHCTSPCHRLQQITMSGNDWRRRVWITLLSSVTFESTVYYWAYHGWTRKELSLKMLISLWNTTMSQLTSQKTFEFFTIRSILHFKLEIYIKGFQSFSKKSCLQWELNPQHWPSLGQKSNACPIGPNRHMLLGRPLTEVCFMHHFTFWT